MAEINENHPLVESLIEAMNIKPGVDTSEAFKSGFYAAKNSLKPDVHSSYNFQKGFYAARAIMEIRIAAVLADYAVPEKSPLDLRIEEMKDGGDISVQSREIDGEFQQRSVLTGPWETVEKPSGLTDPS